MAEIEELFSGRVEQVSEDNPRLEVAYVAKQATGEGDVKQSALDQIPESVGNMKRTQIVIDERVNEDTWKLTAFYEKDETEEEPEPVFSFDTGGGSQHITQSIATVSKHGPDASDVLGGAIGFDGENIAGVDITVPVYNFTETHFFPDEVVTNAFKGNLFRITGKVNSDHFRGLRAGECLFLGASGSRRGEDGDWEITFKFAGSPNREGITIGDIGGISKKGWEYLWVQYADEVDDGPKVLVKKPTAVYIEKVYEEAAFSGLGIGND